MSALIRRNLLFTWLAAITASLLWVAWVQASVERNVKNFDEITVHRINIVEPDGKPRVIISNRASMAGLYWGGKEYKHHNRDDGGFLFFNDNGDEVGGFLFKNRSKGDDYSASTSLLFDQYQQQETLALVYSEENHQRRAGLQIYDQPDQSIFPAIDLSDKLRNAATDAEREKLQAQMQDFAKSIKSAGAFTDRFFAGKEKESSIVRLADKQGRPRLVLKVDAAGTASVEFLDETGKVVRRIPEA